MSRRPSDVPADVRAELNAGTRETRNLAEGLAVDPLALLAAVAPEVAPRAEAAGVGGMKITRSMQVVGRLLHESLGKRAISRLAKHPSDTVRGWAAYALAARVDLTLDRLLVDIRPLADDPHFGVREWAWLAVRPRIAAEPEPAIGLLQPWTAESAAGLRRFASEATRPRGVWCVHITELKGEPRLGLPVLEPLRADGERYVQDSVSNWLNDAAKDRPEWVLELCGRWLRESPEKATQRICRRAQRSLPPEDRVV